VGFVPFLGHMLLIFSLKKKKKEEESFWAGFSKIQIKNIRRNVTNLNTNPNISTFIYYNSKINPKAKNTKHFK
jgi:hypothetical protein